MAEMINVPTTTCGSGLHTQFPSSEPVFHFVQKDGHHGIASLHTVKMWGRSMDEDGVPAEEIYSDLYVLLPKAREMIRCRLTLIEIDCTTALEISSLDPLYGPALCSINL